MREAMMRRREMVAVAVVVAVWLSAWGQQSVAQTTPPDKAPAAKEPTLADLTKGLAIGGKAGTLKFKGYVQTRYTTYEQDGKFDGFTLKSAYVVPHGTLFSHWDFEAEIDAADTSGKVLRNAFVEYTGFGPAARIRVGQQKPSYAEEFWTSSSTIDTADRAKAVTTLCAERDTGINVLGKLAGDRVDYGLGVFNGNGINAADADDTKDVVGRVIVTPLKGLGEAVEGFRVGGGAWLGDRDAGNVTRYVGIAGYKFGPAKLQAEYLFQHVGDYTTVDAAGKPAAVAEKDSNGWYALGVCDVWNQGDALLQAVAKYEAFDPDEDKRDDRDDALTIGINWFFNKYVKLMLNYKFKNEDKRVKNDEAVAQLQGKF